MFLATISGGDRAQDPVNLASIEFSLNQGDWDVIQAQQNMLVLATVLWNWFWSLKTPILDDGVLNFLDSPQKHPGSPSRGWFCSHQNDQGERSGAVRTELARRGFPSAVPLCEYRHLGDLSDGCQIPSSYQPGCGRTGLRSGR